MYWIVDSSRPAPQGSSAVSGVSKPETYPTLEAKAQAIGRLGWTCQQQDLMAEAQDHYREAIELLESDDVRRQWRLVVPLKNNLATVLRAKGHLREAECCYVQAINLMEECDSPPWGAELAGLYANLAVLYTVAGLPEAGVRMQEQCVRILEKSCPPAATRERLQSLKQLAKLYRRAGMAAKADECTARCEGLAWA